ncbi:MAG: ATP-binding protein [Streptosporangiaceae bacterium]|jgi:signal transduction histidine kinase
MSIPRLRLASPSWLRLPRPTARLRLTALYGLLFLAGAAAMLGIIYLIMATASSQANASTGQRATLGLPQGGAIHQSTTAFTLGELPIASGIALGIVSVAVAALSWLAAGRILRPLATITATARRISATSLHERLSLPGPEDELKDLGDTLDDLFDRLEASFEAQRHFVANASHELRTPLAADRTVLQVALEDPAPSGMWRAAGEELLASNTEQERLIEALLTLATSQGGLDHREPIDLSVITDELLLAQRPEIGRLGLRVEAITKPATLHGDPVLAERLVANLIDNAVKHNIPGGCIQVTTGTSHGHATLSVASTGPAIPPADVGRLFQPFQRLHPRRNGNGHGLGLSIVRAIATAHDADITAKAPPSGGLAVTLTFHPPPAPRTATVHPPQIRANRDPARS